MAMTLADFQDRFQQLLLGGDDDAGLARLSRQPAFAVYRNTVFKACIDALVANHPGVARLVGVEWIRAAASVHLRRSPPRDGSLLDYGADFAAFLDDFPPAAPMPWLAAVARLDRCRTESHAAADATPLDSAALTTVPIDALPSCRLMPHPACRWIRCEDAPVFSLWSGQRDDIEWLPEGALVTRPIDAVIVSPLCRSGHAFIRACADGATFGEAAATAVEADNATDLSAMLATLLRAGAFTRVITPEISAVPAPLSDPVSLRLS